MKKFLILFIAYLFVSTSVFAKDIRFVQVTDVRYSKGNDTLSSVVQAINNEKDIAFTVFTGDNIDKPSKENLEGFLLETKKLKKPYYIVYGDKDVNRYKDLSKKEYAKILKKKIKRYKPELTNYVFENNDVVFFVVDGSKDVIPSTNGYYKADVLEWVDANLALYPKKNIVIFQHFPLIPPTDNENYFTFKPEEYLKIINNHKNIKAVISGHFGVNKEFTIDGVLHISTAPAPAYRVIDMIDCTSKNPTFWAQIKEAK